jgi:hypothetical protein
VQETDDPDQLIVAKFDAQTGFFDRFAIPRPLN